MTEKESPLETLLVDTSRQWGYRIKQLVRDLLMPFVRIEKRVLEFGGVDYILRWRDIVPEEHKSEWWELARGVKAELLDLDEGRISDARARRLVELLKDDEPQE